MEAELANLLSRRGSRRPNRIRFGAGRAHLDAGLMLSLTEAGQGKVEEDEQGGEAAEYGDGAREQEKALEDRSALVDGAPAMSLVSPGGPSDTHVSHTRGLGLSVNAISLQSLLSLMKFCRVKGRHDLDCYNNSSIGSER